MASVEALTVPDKTTSMHISAHFTMPAADGVTFGSAEKTIPILPALPEAEDKKADENGQPTEPVIGG